MGWNEDRIDRFWLRNGIFFWGEGIGDEWHVIWAGANHQLPIMWYAKKHHQTSEFLGGIAEERPLLVRGWLIFEFEGVVESYTDSWGLFILVYDPFQFYSHFSTNLSLISDLVGSVSLRDFADRINLWSLIWSVPLLSQQCAIPPRSKHFSGESRRRRPKVISNSSPAECRAGHRNTPAEAPTSRLLYRPPLTLRPSSQQRRRQTATVSPFRVRKTGFDEKT